MGKEGKDGEGHSAHWLVRISDWDPFQIQPWRQSNAGMFKLTTEAWLWQGLSSGVGQMLGEETSGKALRLSVILRKQNVTWFLFVSAWKQMFLCLSFLGLISLLSFSEFSLFICKWKSDEGCAEMHQRFPFQMKGFQKDSWPWGAWQAQAASSECPVSLPDVPGPPCPRVPSRPT